MKVLKKIYKKENRGKYNGRKTRFREKDKNIAQLLVELTTVQAQIKLVKAAIFMNKQKAAISTKLKDFKTYAEG